jgi:hypothetical protein
MRKLSLTLATTVALLSAGALAGTASAMAPAGAGLNAAIAGSGLIDKARFVCSNFWNGHWHRHERCFWVPDHRHHHHWHRY